MWPRPDSLSVCGGSTLRSAVDIIALCGFQRVKFVSVWRGTLIEEMANVLHTSDEQATLGVEVEQRLPAETLPILDHVRLVENEVLPLLALEHLCILQ